MKVIFTILMLLSVNAFAIGSAVLAPSAGSPMLTTYAISSVQLASELGQAKSLVINNTTSSEIACIATHNTDRSVPNDNHNQGVASEAIMVPATTAYALGDFYPSKQVFCRSNSGSTIVSGRIFVLAY